MSAGTRSTYKPLPDEELQRWYGWNAQKRNEPGPITAQDLRLIEMQLALCEELFRFRSAATEVRNAIIEECACVAELRYSRSQVRYVGGREELFSYGERVEEAIRAIKNAAPQANKGSITGSPVPCPAVAAPVASLERLADGTTKFLDSYLGHTTLGEEPKK